MIDPTARIFSDPAKPRPEARSTQSLEQPRPFREQLFESFAPATPPRKAIPERPEAQKPRTEPAANARRDDTASREAARPDGPAERIEPSTQASAPQEPVPTTSPSDAADARPNEEASVPGDKAADDGQAESAANASPTDATSASTNASTSQANAATQAADSLALGPGLTGKQPASAASATPIDASASSSAAPGQPLANAGPSNQTGTSTGDQPGEGESQNPANTAPKADPANAPRTGTNASAASFSGSGHAASAEPAPIQPSAPGQANATASTANGANLADGSDALNEARLTRGLRSALNQQGGSVTLRLTPPEMGTVRIQMQLQGTQVTAQFHAETDAARSMLQQQLGQLRSALEGQGLSVERLGVQSMSGSNASSFNGSSTQQQNQNFSQNPQDPGANADGRSRGFFQQSRDPHDTPSRRDAERRDSFAELVDALN